MFLNMQKYLETAKNDLDKDKKVRENLDCYFIYLNFWYLDWKARGDCKKNSLRSSKIKFGAERVENFATS